VHIFVLQDTDKLAHLSVAELHPSFAMLTPGVRKLHARNFLILQGNDFAVCWTAGGIETGGTGQGIRIAERMHTQMWNLGDPLIYAGMIARLKEVNAFKQEGGNDE
jgi:hypothetical protein